MGERKIDRDMIAEIDLHENGLYVVREGALTKVSPQKYGEDIIKWQDSKVFEIIRHEKIRLNGQDMV